MATFKVGQRVRVLVVGHGVAVYCKRPPVPAGCEATVSSVQGGDTYTINADGVPNPRGSRGLGWFVTGDELAPLTDPDAERFLESIRKLKPLHEEPKVQREKTPHPEFRE